MKRSLFVFIFGIFSFFPIAASEEAISTLLVPGPNIEQIEKTEISTTENSVLDSSESISVSTSLNLVEEEHTNMILPDELSESIKTVTLKTHKLNVAEELINLIECTAFGKISSFTYETPKYLETESVIKSIHKLNMDSLESLTINIAPEIEPSILEALEGDLFYLKLIRLKYPHGFNLKNISQKIYEAEGIAFPLLIVRYDEENAAEIQSYFREISSIEGNKSIEIFGLTQPIELEYLEMEMPRIILEPMDE